jgi:hypothetical protein
VSIDEIEKLARDCIAEPVRGADALNLARAVLAMLPAIRAIPGVLDDETNAASGYARAFHLRVLREAVEQMREVLK